MGKYLEEFLLEMASHTTDSVDVVVSGGNNVKTVGMLSEATEPTMSTPSVRCRDNYKQNCGRCVSALQPDEMTSGYRDVTSTDLHAFQGQAAGAGNIRALLGALAEFNKGDWTLLDRAAMCNAYTPHATRLIEREVVDKHRLLERLAALCWAKRFTVI